jgi:phosphoribosylformimino-5-aminoimidazole carboxamide ribonucleotide (ProFAR) isomerase
MIIIPAVELPHPDHPATSDPRDIVRELEWRGFQGIHLVEPVSRNDRPLNRREAEDLLREIHIDVQVAGNIRSADDIEALTQAGATRVVLGSRALDEPEWLTANLGSFPDVLVVETAARERRVRSRGWVRTLPVDVRDLADELADYPLAGLLVTFSTDAAIDHADLALIEDLTDRLSFPVFVGGGAQTMATLRDLEFRGVTATIIDAARLADNFDEETLARSFAD